MRKSEYLLAQLLARLLFLAPEVAVPTYREVEGLEYNVGASGAVSGVLGAYLFPALVGEGADGVVALGDDESTFVLWPVCETEIGALEAVLVDEVDYVRTGRAECH